MKTLCAALLLAIFASSPASAKVWVDAECSTVLISDGSGQFYLQGPDKALISCSIANWPISSPTADMACASGAPTKMELKGQGVVILNDLELNPYDGPLPCGSNGAEWPD